MSAHKVVITGVLHVQDGNPPYPDNSLPGGGNYPDNSLPGFQPYPDNSLPGFPGRPSHPIVIPPSVSHPIVIPPYVQHPIVIPPCDCTGGGGGPVPPVVWPPSGTPSHPIVLPPNTPTHPIVIPPVGGSGEPPKLELWPPLVDNTLPTPPPPVVNPLPSAYVLVYSLVYGWALVPMTKKK